jgi:hypothetical protein
MFSVNFTYGHREIILKYCGLDYSNQIIGILEHGASGYWTDFDFKTPRFLNGNRAKYWAWSYETESLANSMGFSHVKAIGAPWYYLKRNLVLEPKNYVSQTDRVLVMPSHSTGNAVDTATRASKVARAKQFMDIVGNAPATACLHAVDFCDQETYAAFREAGFEVTCVGNSFQQPLWSSAGSRVRMMFNLHQLLMSHTHYLSDGYGTSLHYAIDMGLSVGIFPRLKENQVLGNEWPGSRDYFRELYLLETEYLEEKIPNLLNTFGDGSEYLEFTRGKLGFDCIREPEELVHLLDYRPNIYPLQLGTEPW